MRIVSDYVAISEVKGKWRKSA